MLATQNERRTTTCSSYGVHRFGSECGKQEDAIDDRAVPLELNLYGHPLAGLSWRGILRNF